LKHLQSLYRELEACSTGVGQEDALLAAVPKQYKAPLSAHQERALKGAAARWSEAEAGGPERVLGGIQGLIKHGTDPLSGYGTGQSLRSLLRDVDFFDIEGEDRWFWEGFPVDLEMRHVAATYQVLVEK
jgi:hypothetical protein